MMLSVITIVVAILLHEALIDPSTWLYRDNLRMSVFDANFMILKKNINDMVPMYVVLGSRLIAPKITGEKQFWPVLS